MILAAKMMLDWLSEQFKEPRYLAAAEAVEEAVVTTLCKGMTVPDLGGSLKTLEMASAIAEVAGGN